MRFVRFHVGWSTALLISLTAAACQPETDGILVELAPEVVSSIDGTTTVRVMVVAERKPVADEQVELTIDYTDRNGVAHAVDPLTGTTDLRGSFEAVVAGLAWEGSGTVTATVVGTPISAEATFSVLDRTPPTVEILPPTTDLHVGPGLPLDVQVRVRDEIGVSEVFLEASGELTRLQSTVVASGSNDATVTFRIEIPDFAFPGPTITLHALAGDLSSNLAAAEPVVLTVDPSITIATPPGLTGGQIADGNGQFLDDPRGLAVSPRDGFLYVADNSGPAPCNGACIRKVNATTGAVDAVAVITGNGSMEGVAFDAVGDNLYYTDRQDVVGRLTWNPLTQRYDAAGFCNDINAGNPVDPYHLVVDANLGILIADDDRQRIARAATCNANAQPTGLTGGDFDQPRGIAVAPTGEIYVSDENRDHIYQVNRTNGQISLWENNRLDQPWGIDWMGGTNPAWSNSLMVAQSGDRTVGSTRGSGTRAAVYLRNSPIDVATSAGTLFVLTRPSAGSRGRIFKVTGF